MHAFECRDSSKKIFLNVRKLGILRNHSPRDINAQCITEKKWKQCAVALSCAEMVTGTNLEDPNQGMYRG